MAPKLLPPELLYETVLFLSFDDVVPNAFASCRMLHDFLLPRAIKWAETIMQRIVELEEVVERQQQKILELESVVEQQKRMIQQQQQTIFEHQQRILELERVVKQQKRMFLEIRENISSAAGGVRFAARSIGGVARRLNFLDLQFLFRNQEFRGQEILEPYRSQNNSDHILEEIRRAGVGRLTQEQNAALYTQRPSGAAEARIGQHMAFRWGGHGVVNEHVGGKSATTTKVKTNSARQQPPVILSSPSTVHLTKHHLKQHQEQAKLGREKTHWWRTLPTRAKSIFKKTRTGQPEPASDSLPPPMDEFHLRYLTEEKQETEQEEMLRSTLSGLSSIDNNLKTLFGVSPSGGQKEKLVNEPDNREPLAKHSSEDKEQNAADDHNKDEPLPLAEHASEDKVDNHSPPLEEDEQKEQVHAMSDQQPSNVVGGQTCATTTKTLPSPPQLPESTTDTVDNTYNRKANEEDQQIDFAAKMDNDIVEVEGQNIVCDENGPALDSQTEEEETRDEQTDDEDGIVMCSIL